MPVVRLLKLGGPYCSS